jgi:HD-GYP domain-containing protein (c-di-GMP phosphodiesterase class II)
MTPPTTAPARPDTSTVRLAELVAALSLATDLGLGMPQEHVLRQTLIATRLADVAGLSADQQASVFYVSLLGWVGCVADSHELARWFDDDRALRAGAYSIDRVGLPMLGYLLRHVASDGPAGRRGAMLGRFLTGGVRDAMASFTTHCQATGEIADRLTLPAEVRTALAQVFERWDGRGVPDRRSGEQIAAAMRVCQIANDAEVYARTGGPGAALRMLRARSGTAFDPALVRLCHEHEDRIFGDLASVDAWGVVIAGCAALDRNLDDDELMGALGTFADFADLKSPWFLGHSRAVASLAALAARRAGWPEPAALLVVQAALVARLGGIGVSTSVWDKPGPLSAAERERVRTVPYLTERVLCRQPRLAAVAAVAAMCYERMDGSGYPRALSGSAISAPARLLAACEVYQALGEPRPYRDALPRAQRESLLLAQAGTGALDHASVQAVLEASGHQVRRRAHLVAGITSREAQVLELLVRGLSNKAIARELNITPRTAGSHVEHIYAKTGVSTRAAAALFALRHGLVSAEPVETPADPAKIG